MLPARHRLRRSADFAAVGGRGRTRSGGRLLVVHLNRNAEAPDRPPRAGFVVPRTVGGAVVRNRTKRVLRALMASRVTGIPAGSDVVVRANPGAATATTVQLGAELDRHLGTLTAGAR